MGCVVKDGMVQLCTGEFERARFESFILCERAGETHYLGSKTAVYIGGGKDIEGNNTEDRRK